MLCAVPDKDTDRRVYRKGGIRNDEDEIPRADRVHGKTHADDKLADKEPLGNTLAGAVLPLLVNLLDECRKQ